MKYTVDKNEQYTEFILLEEKVDALRTPLLKTELTTLNAEGIRNFIIDLGQVKYVDSSGLSALLLANRLCTQSGGILVLFKVNDAVTKLIKISHLDKVLTLLPSREEAIDAVFLHEIESDLKKEGAEEE